MLARTCMCLIAMASGVYAQDVATQSRSISVSGTATTRVVPDIIVWSIQTTDENQELATAKSASDRKLSSIMALLKELKISGEDIQTGFLDISRMYEENKSTRGRTFRGFSVRRGVTIKQRDLSRFDEYLSKLAASTDMEASFLFDSSKREEIRWQTRLDALRIAHDKARVMAETVGAKAGKVLTIIESQPAMMPISALSQSNVVYVSPAGGSDSDSVSGTFAPGSIEIQVTVHATFQLE
ncbi:MAG: hypothetical protein AMXMBFR84_15590 [Candidatus Hydrogenedentota bacterium]